MSNTVIYLLKNGSPVLKQLCKVMYVSKKTRGCLIFQFGVMKEQIQ